ncbi:MAG: hypothetical protein ACLFQM_07400 [Fidelibacterota bacterium]
MKRLLLFLIIFVFVNGLFAEISITSKIDTTIATVGDQVTLNIRVRYEEKNTRIDFPNINDELQNYSLIARESGKAEKIATGFLKEFNFKIALFDTGKIKLPELTVALHKDSADQKLFRTSPHLINVISILPPDENVPPKDIKPPFPLPTIIPWDIVIFVLILLVIFIAWYLWYRRWKQDHPKVAFDEKYLDPPHIIALKKLAAIRKMAFHTESEIIKTYTEISYVLREYLENRFFIRALEMPTRDISENLADLEISGTIMFQIEDILQKLDIIKFANQLPEPEEKNRIIDTAEKIIEETKIDNFLNQHSGLTEAREMLEK